MNTNRAKDIKELAKILLSRLEKISSDSPWAHQASGVRASIAKIISRENLNPGTTSSQDLGKLLDLGFEILEKAAAEIPEDRKP
jgi:hypothetical protein